MSIANVFDLNDGHERPALNIAQVRQDFPILSRKVNGRPLVYLDNAASTQKPQVVIDRERAVYENEYANIHRGVHYLSQHLTDAYEKSRETAREFINAESVKEIIFTRGTTESINLVAQSFCRPRLKPGDEILISAMEHHSNIVPWQLLCEQTGARLQVIPIDDHGQLLLDEAEQLLNEHTRLLAVAHVSNALGSINPVELLIRKARAKSVPVLLDGAQAVAHLEVDVRALDCDFYAFSAHKIFGPTGVGVLYGRRVLLEEMPPYQGGGDMILSVTFEKTTYNELPFKFEAGTPHIAGVIGFGEALRYVKKIGLRAINQYENQLLAYATRRLKEVPGLRIVGNAPCKASLVSFTIDGIHPHDIGTILDQDGVAIRTGHHCAQPVMERFGVPATARASMAFYNTKEEIDALVTSVLKAVELFA